MKLITVKNYEVLSQIGARMIIEKVQSNPAIVLGLATGGTPKGVYEKIIQNHQKNGISYQNVVTFNLDEYIGLAKNDRNSYRSYMNQHLFDHLDIPFEQTHIPSGEAADLEQECERYETLIQQHNGIDLQTLGIGINGHIGFNEPGTSFSSITHIVELMPSTRQANAHYFQSLEDVPTQAITMGISTIMKSKEILLFVSGEAKQQAMQQLLEGKLTEDFPASILQKHPNVTIIADEKALANVKSRS
jgi:glucosamine-6-phosphate deaminase